MREWAAAPDLFAAWVRKPSRRRESKPRRRFQNSHLARSNVIFSMPDTEPCWSKRCDVYLRFAIPLWVIAFWGCAPSTGKEEAVPDWRRVPVSIELRLAEGAPAPGLVPARVYGQADTVYLHPEAQLSNSGIARVEAAKTMGRRGLVLELWLTQTGAERLAEVTGQHIGDSLAVLINSAVVSVPMIEEPIGRDTKAPSHLGVPLLPEEAEQLAVAVSKTWPPAPARSGGKMGKDGM